MSPPVAAATRCALPTETAAFHLRQLQSRLMVAALACNQRPAYNAFVSRFRPSLAAAGGRIEGYFQRIGGGPAGLDDYLTALANTASLARAENPGEYCRRTWDLFWTLDHDPAALAGIAEANLLSVFIQPSGCSPGPLAKPPSE